MQTETNEMERNYKDLDRLQRADHDTLIRVETKLDSLVAQVTQLQDGVNKRVTELEIRVGKIDELHAKVNPLEMMAAVDDLKSWKQEIKVTTKTTIAIASGISSAIGFIIGIVSKFI